MDDVDVFDDCSNSSSVLRKDSDAMSRGRRGMSYSDNSDMVDGPPLREMEDDAYDDEVVLVYPLAPVWEV